MTGAFCELCVCKEEYGGRVLYRCILWILRKLVMYPYTYLY